MSKNKDKYIDMNQFPVDKNGHVLWSKSVGVVAEFFYCGDKHIIEILDRGKPNKDYVKIKIDDMLVETVNTQKIRNLSFGNLFHKPDYFYNVGDIVNGSIILEQLYIKENNKNGYRKKCYKCKCSTDGYEYTFGEAELKSGRKCPMCTGKKLIVGHNDLATTNPEIIKFLLDKEDGYRYTKGSHKQVQVICPICGYKKIITIEYLVYNGGISCPKCSDGLSYPNKFSHNVFEQIHEQYEKYVSEYSPDWAGKMRYDNYILLKDGKEIIVEMDGGFHYNDYGKRSAQNDAVKDALAEEHGIKMIRINCFYNKITERFELIKNGVINSLKEYFDLSCVDWNSADKAGISNRLIEVVNYYTENPLVTNQQIANYFHTNVVTIRHYLTVGEKVGLCTYIRHDPNRYKTSIPLALYDSNHNLIGTFISSRDMAEKMSDKDFHASSIRESAKLGRTYKGYVIKQITWKEYEQYQNIA